MSKFKERPGRSLDHLWYYKENLMIKVSHMISEMTKIPLQIRLFMTFTVYLMLWKILHMNITP